jgi:polyferredoxin
MDHIGKPRGLVRFASEETIANGTPFRVTRRMLAYSAVLTILVTVFCSMLLLRSEVEMTLMRTPGVLYQEREDGRVSNLYNVKVINKTSNDITFDLKVLNQPNVEVEWIGGTPTAKAQSAFSGSLFILMPKEDIQSISTKLKLGVYEGEEEIETVKTTFLGPN